MNLAIMEASVITASDCCYVSNDMYVSVFIKMTDAQGADK